ncbi:MAG: ABC transporter substrate-binding protein [Treponema sp.]|jgi:putative aldouronate transport system substrate-binding protein|nr:ABC transporter substrate-binding protein [Treponema sp.]
MLAGKVAAQIGTTGFGAGIDYTREAKQNNPSTEMVFATIPYAYAKKQAVAVHPTQNGFSIPITAANIERAVAVYEKLVLDREYFNLIQYGIENEDYKIVDNTYVEIPGGFQREAARLWAARSDALYLPSGNWRDYEPFKQKFAEYEGPNKIGGFVEDSIPYQAERAALMNVVSQYLVPLQAGMTDDVDAAVNEFLKNAEAAGMDRLHELYIKQWHAHVDANNEWK